MSISHGKEHGNRVHSKTKSFICEECNQSFSAMKYLRKHQRIHEGTTTYCCSECNESFSSLGDLNMHKILVHYSVKCVYNCSECDKTFAYHCLLKKKHMRSHNKEPQNPNSYKTPCLKCNESFSTPSDLQQHKIDCHPQIYCIPCPECDKSLDSQNNLKTHLQSHSTIHTEARPFICSECDRSFIAINNLKRHLHVHRKEK